MFLSKLTKKEKLKFLDLAIFMASVDGKESEMEKKLLEIMVVEMGDVKDEYTFDKSDDIEGTIQYFVDENNIIVQRIVFLNLIKLMMYDDLYTTREHEFLENVQQAFNISPKVRRDLMKIIYDERDLRLRAKRVIEND